mmetsp:Transcript_23224/g.22792  ORF Transcript_23224/g.22792 Transcript_23224/m.22792 type:complete len:276 (+) Transcript_23224:811-1638(+)
MPYQILKDCSQRIKAAIFKKGEVILDKGKYQKELIIIYEGSIIQSKKFKLNDIREGEGTFFREKECVGFECLSYSDSLQEGQKSSKNNLICFSSEVKCLLLHQQDYKSIEEKFYKSELHKKMTFFAKYSACKLWSSGKLEIFCNFVKYKIYKRDQLVIDKEEVVESVIFVMEGGLRMDKEITLEFTNQWPVSHNQWEVHTQKNTQTATIVSIKEGDYLGVKEMLDGLNFPGKLICNKDDTVLIFIHRDDFKLLFTPHKDTQLLIQECPVTIPDEN